MGSVRADGVQRAVVGGRGAVTTGTGGLGSADRTAGTGVVDGQ